MLKKEFHGIFKDELENYVKFKKSQGFYKNFDNKEIYDLLRLNEFLDSFNLNEIMITEEMTLKYIELAKKNKKSTAHLYECQLRQFSKFLKNQGYENIYIQYSCIVKAYRDYIPYVFSDNEIKRIMYAVDHMEFKNSAKSVLFYQTLIRLLYCTGLRLGEALNLKVEDIDLNNNVLTVYGGKRDVSRIIPFRLSLSKWLKKYQKVFYKETDTYFFESPKGGKRSNSGIGTVFRNKILFDAGISSFSDYNLCGRGACIHSLRHTFACNALDQMIKSGKDPYCALPYLSFYMGHTSIVNTEIYLRLTLQRYDEVVDAGHFIYEKGLDFEDD
ncbi:MAG: tyrosine-type recombinase/integrase [Erysipelotrichaceae bacterium]|nr:tyrosine-type recombinase/integrase [Erysipelotrichaceae bacterium]